jgi:hypothetical protein
MELDKQEGDKSWEELPGKFCNISEKANRVRGKLKWIRTKIRYVEGER